jgi:hypothetical protein
MRTQEITIFTFEELTPEAQQRAIEKNRNINVNFKEWSEPIIEKATDTANTAGFTVKTIYFSGFWSQGDGAMFEYTGLEGETLKNEFIDGLNLSAMRKNWLKNNIHTSAGGRQFGHYYHENSCSHRIYWEIDNGDIHYSSPFYNWLESYAGQFEEFIIEKYKNLCGDIYKNLSNCYDELTSDECIKETLIANEYEYTEEGDLY